MDKSFQVVLMYLITHLGIIFFMSPGNIIASTDEGHWIPILAVVIINFILVSVYMKGLNYFPNEDLVSIYRRYGKVVAFIFLFPVTLYFIMIYILTIRAKSEIITVILLSETPLWAIMALLIFISTYLAIKGLETILRTAVLLSCVFIPFIFFILCLSFQNVDWYYIFPLIDKQFSFIMDSSFYKSFYGVGGALLFLGFIQPFVSFQRKQILIAAIILFPFFIVSVYIPILTFGQATASTFILPFEVAMDTINLNWLMFDRISMFFLMVLMAFIMLYASLVMWKTTRILNTCLPTIKPIYLNVTLSSLVFIVCLMIPGWNEIERIILWNTFLEFYTLISVTISVYYFGFRFRRGDKYEEN
ncbi:GerAB/ArcD/ProY family transporter [Viridibacillus arvi]|uniref:GerAB/ArcD/ProY family transporter n=1 Tax=Viridibacillus arvi TaxID=263475 RepID=UPI0034CE0493